jgi:hypothetical protein
LRYVKPIGKGVLFFKTAPNFVGFLALCISHMKGKKRKLGQVFALKGFFI